jgi:small-conductance mechanosensitive channel
MLGLLKNMKNAEIRAMKATLKTLVNMQVLLDATGAQLDARITEVEAMVNAVKDVDPSPDPQEIAAYEAERKNYGTIANIVGADGINREPKPWWENKV